VILGSYNWTEAGAYDNDENTLFLHDRELARAYYAEWQRLRNAVKVLFFCRPWCIMSLPDAEVESAC